MKFHSADSSFEMVAEGTDGTQPATSANSRKTTLKFKAPYREYAAKEMEDRPKFRGLVVHLPSPHTEESLDYDECEDDSDEEEEEEEASDVEFEEKEEDDEICELLEELEQANDALSEEKKKHRETATKLVHAEIALTNADAKTTDLKLKEQQLENLTKCLLTEKHAQSKKLVDMEDQLTVSTMSINRLEAFNQRLIRDWEDLKEEVNALREGDPQKIQELQQVNEELIEENRLLRDENRYRLKEHEELRNELEEAKPLLEANRALKSNNLELNQYCVELQKKCMGFEEELKEARETGKALKKNNSEIIEKCLQFTRKYMELHEEKKKLAQENAELKESNALSSSEVSKECAELREKCSELNEQKEKLAQEKSELEEASQIVQAEMGEAREKAREATAKLMDMNEKHEKLVEENSELQNGLASERGQSVELQNKVQQLEKANSDLHKMVTHFKAALDLKDSEPAASNKDEEDQGQEVKCITMTLAQRIEKKKMEAQRARLEAFKQQILERHSKNNQ